MRIADDEIQSIINDYEKPMTIREIAKKYKMPIHVIRNILIKNNIKLHHGGGKKGKQVTKTIKDKTDEIIKLYEEGKTYNEISSKTTVKQGTIQSILRRNKVKTGKRGINKNKPTRICKTLRKHHEQLKDDPERLNTEFMLKLIKGE